MSLRRAFFVGLAQLQTLDDASRYLVAAGITDLALAADVRWFVQALKDASLWDKIRAFWPVLGGTATSHRVNLKQPAAFPLTFNGGSLLRHTAGGMGTSTAHNDNLALRDGTDVYIDTTFNLGSDMSGQDGYGLHYYTNNQGVASPSDSADMGLFGSVSEALLLSASNRDSGGGHAVGRALGGLLVGTSVATQGLYSVQQTAAGTAQLLRNAVVEASLSGPATPPLAASVFLMATRYGGGKDDFGYGFSGRPCQAAAITDALTSTDLQAFYNLIQQLQTRRGRAA